MDTLVTLALLAAAPWVGALIAAGARLWDEDAPATPAAPAAGGRAVRAAFAPPFLGWRTGRPAWRRPAAELGALGVAAWAAAASPGEDYALYLTASCVLGWLLLALAVVDAHVWRLPDPLTGTLAAAGVVATLALFPERLAGHVIGAAAGYGALWGLAAAYERLRGRPGLGLGDAKLLGAVGFWIGWRGLPLAAAGAAAVALGAVLAWALVQRLQRRGPAVDAQTALPFGPFLAAGAWLAWWWTEAVAPPL